MAEEMEAKFFPFDESSEFDTPERCFIVEMLNTPDDPDLSIARARVAPGVSTQWHCVLDTAERYVIVQGSGRVEIGELPPRVVGVGDVVLIPPSCRQRIANLGTEDLVFLAICTPRFEKCNYQNLSGTVR